jgi:hypothetical protein
MESNGGQKITTYFDRDALQLEMLQLQLLMLKPVILLLEVQSQQ